MNIKILVFVFTSILAAPSLQRSQRFAQSQWRSVKGQAINRVALKRLLSRMHKIRGNSAQTKSTVHGNLMSGFQLRRRI